MIVQPLLNQDKKKTKEEKLQNKKNSLNIGALSKYNSNIVKPHQKQQNKPREKSKTKRTLV